MLQRLGYKLIDNAIALYVASLGLIVLVLVLS